MKIGFEVSSATQFSGSVSTRTNRFIVNKEFEQNLMSFRQVRFGRAIGPFRRRPIGKKEKQSHIIRWASVVRCSIRVPAPGWQSMAFVFNSEQRATETWRAGIARGRIEFGGNDREAVWDDSFRGTGDVRITWRRCGEIKRTREGTNGVVTVVIHSFIWMIRVNGEIGAQVTVGATRVHGNQAFRELWSTGGRGGDFFIS